MSRVRKYKDDIRMLSKLSARNRKLLIAGSNSELIKAIGDICLNLIKNKIPLKISEKKKLRNYLKELRILATSRLPLKQKKKVLSNQRGGLLLGLLVNALKNLF